MRKLVKVESVKPLCEEGFVLQVSKNVRRAAREFWMWHNASASDQVFRVVPCQLLTYTFENSCWLQISQSSLLFGVCSVVNAANQIVELSNEFYDKGLVFVNPAEYGFYCLEVGLDDNVQVLAGEIARWCSESSTTGLSVAVAEPLGGALNFNQKGRQLKGTFAEKCLIISSKSDAELAIFKMTWL